MNGKIKLIYLLQQLAFAVILAITVYLAATGKLIAALLLAAVAVYVIFDLRLSLFVPVISRLNTKDKKILLTFDDAPSVNTEKILATLERENISAVFFIIGKNVFEREKTVERIAQSGHLLGIHTQNHYIKTTFSNIKHVKAEIEICQKILENISGQKINLFRPPFGVMNPVIAMVVRELNLRVVGWSIRSLDTQTTNKDRLIKKIVRRLSSGAIVLLHDIPLTAEILPELIAKIRKKGYGFHCN